MGVPLSGPSIIYGDNTSVIQNTLIPESTLQKKYNSIFYHAIQESVAMVESLTAWVPTGENPFDLSTEVLYGSKRRHVVGSLLHYIYDEH